MLSKNLPVVPATVLQKYQVHEPTDDRFQAVARLLQSLWRDRQGIQIGEHVGAAGVIRTLGSRIADGAANGRNFLSGDVAQLAWREMIYREAGAVVYEDRLWTNLLASQPLTFNLFGPMKLDMEKATAFIRAMCADLADADATGVLFEHSPGRDDPALTGDRTAFDAVITYTRPGDRSGLVAIEVKYTENLLNAQREMRASCHAAMVASNLFSDAGDATLRAAPLQQLTREHVLAQMAITRGDYDEGRFVVVYPELNASAAQACSTYATRLADAGDAHAKFESWTLEAVVEAIRAKCDAAYADSLFARYLDWAQVEQAIEASRPITHAPKRLTDRRKR